MKFDMYCDWSPAAIGVVVVEQGRGVYYNRFETEWHNHNNSCQGELEAVNICFNIVDELGLENVTIHTDHEPLVLAIERNIVPKCRGTKNKTSRANKIELYRNTIQRFLDRKDVKAVHCKSHANNVFNCAADVLARKQSEDAIMGDWEQRLRANNKFHTAAKRATVTNPTLWDVAQAWFINMVYGVVVC
ncbi:hypothetical protein KNV07_gp123 [Vibrio phage Cody]|uniref:RNase H type-1 domain-containing protein n=2 Tax=Thalassavirus TaxID=2948922 RepID=A0A6M9Z0Q4_9CAUD|nr:hypothetical protein KNV06_gp121 [Vibrio phage AG74]YP_010108399.1 hypothetical protein KNV07_gp123 [Vibrio phage Cody]QIG66477.1 hypothetical protein CHAZLY21_186 [Vibrio phage Chazly21]QQO90000.1 hypothetical protein ABURR_190 [Vibrio phage ABurr]QKN85022.1 hypothetical protein AG74_186 [Vibrio phage AG74]QKN85213.1 hypothetical protein CODY_187 [Vibrio phage Cody]